MRYEVLLYSSFQFSPLAHLLFHWLIASMHAVLSGREILCPVIHVAMLFHRYPPLPMRGKVKRQRPSVPCAQSMRRLIGSKSLKLRIAMNVRCQLLAATVRHVCIRWGAMSFVLEKWACPVTGDIWRDPERDMLPCPSGMSHAIWACNKYKREHGIPRKHQLIALFDDYVRAVRSASSKRADILSEAGRPVDLQYVVLGRACLCESPSHLRLQRYLGQIHCHPQR